MTILALPKAYDACGLFPAVGLRRSLCLCPQSANDSFCVPSNQSPHQRLLRVVNAGAFKCLASVPEGGL